MSSMKTPIIVLACLAMSSSVIHLANAESTIVTVTADPPASSSTTSSESSGDKEIGGTSSSVESESTVESLNFRLRYVEQALLAYSRNIISLSKRVKQLESMLQRENNKPSSNKNYTETASKLRESKHGIYYYT